MIIPVRCYSCGKTIAHLYEPYRKLLDEDYTEAEALEAVGAVRYCCRRMLLTHIDLIDNLMPYSSPVVGTMQRVRPAASVAGGQQPLQQQQQQQQTGAAAAAAAATGASPQQQRVQGDASAASAGAGGARSASANSKRAK